MLAHPARATIVTMIDRSRIAKGMTVDQTVQVNALIRMIWTGAAQMAGERPRRSHSIVSHANKNFKANDALAAESKYLHRSRASLVNYSRWLGTRFSHQKSDAPSNDGDDGCTDSAKHTCVWATKDARNDSNAEHAEHSCQRDPRQTRCMGSIVQVQ